MNESSAERAYLIEHLPKRSLNREKEKKEKLQEHKNQHDNISK